MRALESEVVDPVWAAIESDSTVSEVFGKAEQGAAYGRTKVLGCRPWCLGPIPAVLRFCRRGQAETM